MNTPLTKLPETVEERLARAMRIYANGEIRPLWEDIQSSQKNRMVEDMKNRIKFFARHGVGVVMLEEKK